MSNMLDQAIIDASALKEAAVKSAEASLLEKYSSQIKEAVESILEQDDEMDPDDPALAGPPPEAEMPELPMASLDGTEACACPDEGAIKRIEIDVEDLLRQLEDGEDEPPEFDRQAAAIEMTGESPALAESFEFDLQTLKSLLDPNDTAVIESVAATSKLDETTADAIAERLTVDLSVDTHRPGHNLVADSVVELAHEELLALEQDSERREEAAAMKKAMKNLEKMNEGLQIKNTKLTDALTSSKEEKQTYIDILEEAKDKLVEINLTNARLLYTNEVLTSDSINERHKQKVVEALSESKTVEEAKVIFETLQSAAGSTINQPQSLSEAVNKTTSTLIMSRRNTERQEIKKDPAIDRWKILAGINNSFNNKEES
jgi:hypothetical protein